MGVELMESQYTLTDEQRMLQETIRRMAQEKIAPRAAEIDRTDQFPWDIFSLLKDNNLLGLTFPEEYGGSGAELLSACITAAELARVSLSVAVLFGQQELTTQPILLGGTEEQKRKYVPKLASGEYIGAFGLTEPGAGSDNFSMTTRAVFDSAYYILNGRKCFITNGDIADVITVFAKTDPTIRGAGGISAFILEKGTQGFIVGKLEEKMGAHGLAAAELIFEDCKIRPENLLGAKEGTGFLVAVQTLDCTRPLVGAMGVGLAQGALDHAIKYAKERVQFGRPIAQFQGIQWKLVDLAIAIEAARQLVYRAACVIAEERQKLSFTKEMRLLGSAAKCYATDVAMKTTIEAAQVFGGYGYVKDYPMERMIRDAKILQIVEGTNEIQRVVIANCLLD